MASVLNKNKGFEILLRIRSMINGKHETDDINITLTTGQNASFKYAPIQRRVVCKRVLVNVNPFFVLIAGYSYLNVFK